MHLNIIHHGEGLFCTLEYSPEVNLHKPAVDVMFDALVEVATNVQTLLLTGMGQNSAQGMLNLKILGHVLSSR